MGNNNIILQPYKVTMAKHELSAIEMRILGLALIKLKDAQINGWNDECYEDTDLFGDFNVVIIKNADITVNSNYRQVRNALRSLTRRELALRSTFNGKPATLFTNLVRSAKYTDDKTEIKLNFEPELMPDLIRLGKNYTKYGINFLFSTKSSHAIRWYQIGSHWKNTGVFTITRDEIRELFKISSEKYKAHKDFFDRVIARPLKEVNTKSDIQMRVTKKHKNGSNIVAYTISITSKNIKGIESTDISSQPNFIKDYLRENKDKIKYLAEKANLAIDYIEKILIQRGTNEVNNYTHYVNQTSKYLIGVFSNQLNQDKEKIKQLWELL